MSQEVVPPSDDDVFISTQIQGKLDELDDEAKMKTIAASLRQYVNKTVDTPPEVPKRPKDIVTKAKPKAKLKRKSKKLSVTDQMIKKLSGKPQKLKQMRLKDNIQRGAVISATPSFEEGSQNNYETVFTSKEWNKLKYVLNVGRSYKMVEKENIEPTHNDGLWDAASDTPKFDMNDWNELYGYQYRCKVSTLEADTVPPITFSQVYKSSQRAIDIHEDQSLRECCEIEQQVTAEDLNTSFGDEVICSSDEGSIIELMSRHIGTDESPIVLDTQDLEGNESLLPTPQSQIKYKGSNVKINQDSKYSAKIKARRISEDEIPGSSDDEDDVSYYIEIVRQESCPVWEIPSSSGYDCDDEFE